MERQAAQDAAHMARAVALAARGHGTTSPNPVVGCVVLDAAGDVVGTGFHAYAGGPHAEVGALRQAGERARGGTAYVTLEPCDHTGRTGPCSLALLAAGVARVVVAVADPNPKAAGGAARLRANGVAVEVGTLGDEAERVNAEWLTYARLGRPHVTWKFAATLDGRSAAADGTSQWITSPEARADVHRLRARADAIVAGVGTVLADDPRLTARPSDDLPPTAGPSDDAGPIPRLPDDSRPTAGPSDDFGPAPRLSGGSGPVAGSSEDDKPLRRLRVVVDSEGRTPPGARVLDGEAPVLVAVADDAVTSLDADLVRLPRHEHGLDLRALLAELAEREVVSVFLEGGPTLAGSFLREGLVDRVVAYLAPALLGSGPAALADAGVATIAGLHRFAFDDISRLGPDLRLTARPATPPHPGKES